MKKTKLITLLLLTTVFAFSQTEKSNIASIAEAEMKSASKNNKFCGKPQYSKL